MNKESRPPGSLQRRVRPLAWPPPHIEYVLERPLRGRIRNHLRAVRGLRLLRKILSKRRLTEEQRRDIIAALAPLTS